MTRGVPGALANDSDLAARFDGSDDYVSVPDNAALDVGDVFSYELWVKRGALQSATQRLIHKGGGVAALGFGLNNKIVLLPGGSGAATTASSTTAITDQTWHHVVATKSGADGARLHRRRGSDGGGHEHDADRERHRAQHRARDDGQRLRVR